MNMEWKQLISNKRFGQEHKHAERHDDRSEFKRDYDRLIFSSAFRRLQNKTQVFPLAGQHLRTQPPHPQSGSGECGHVDGQRHLPHASSRSALN